MPRKTIRLPGKKHQFPKCMSGFFNDLESMVGVEDVGIGKFVHKGGDKDFLAKIKLYDSATRTLKVDVTYEGFFQVYFVKVDPDHKERVEEFIRAYRPR